MASIKICSITGETKCKCLHKQDGVSIPHPKETMRKLFTDHAVFTKMVITAVLDGRPEADSLVKRLLNNQVEIGDYLGHYIGPAYGKAVTDLLTEHIKRASGILTAVSKGVDPQPAVQSFFANVEDVTQGLVSIPGNKLSYEDVKTEFYQHAKFIIDLVNAHMNKLWDEEIRIYDAYYSHMLKFSDVLYMGLIH